MLRKKRLTAITAVYWFLLVYIIAALVWWFVSLHNQNRRMAGFRISRLEATIDSNFSPLLYKAELAKIKRDQERKNAQYNGEGLIFFFFILLGALFVYRAVRRQISLTQQQQNFMMAITHELKTPLAVAKLNIETMIRRRLDEEKQQKLLDSTLRETDRLNILINNILVASQFEGQGYQASKEELDLSALVTGCIRDFRQRFPGRVIEEDVSDGIMIRGDALLLQLLVNNLVENAIKYAPPKTPVTCRLSCNGAQCTLAVADQGPGIAEEEKSKVFNKFYRIGNENTRNSKGTGLGLYLSKKIAKEHGGDIAVTDNIPSGSIFTVKLKAYPAPHS
jgi:two-component system, OmpR family, sensor histidine kinase CiaH